jgi:glycosyltransferase involved in cell wall biosynthesis
MRCQPEESVPVLLLIGGLGPAGAEQQARLLLQNLPPGRVRAHLACFESPPEVLRLLDSAGIGIDLLPRYGRYVWPIRLHGLLWKIVRRRGIRIVHAFLPDLAPIALALRATVPGLRVVVGRRSLDEYLDRRQLRFLRATSRKGSVIVANAEAVAASVRAYEGDPGARLRVIPNALPLPALVSLEERAEARAFFGLTERDFAIAYPAHFRRHKGHDHLPEIARIAGSSIPGIVFLLAGDIDSNARYRANHARFIAETERLGVTRHFRYAGVLPDSRVLLAASDAAANFSDMEGMSNTIMEAMGTGLPVVASAVGGTPELIVDGCQGWLINAGDRKTAAERIARLVADPEERRRMGQAGRRRIATDFPVERMVSSYVALYEELAEDSQRGLRRP